MNGVRTAELWAGRRPAVRAGLLVVAALLVGLGVGASALPPANPWPWPLLLPGLVLAAVAVAAGVLLLGASRWDGLLWSAGGLVGLLAVLGGGGWGPVGVADRLGLLAALSLLPAAVVAHPGTLPRLHRWVVLPLLGVVGALVLVLGYVPGLVDTLELLLTLTVFGSVWWRFERGAESRPGPGRDALRWLALALALMLLVSIPASFTRAEVLGLVVSTLALLAVPAAVVAGTLLGDRVEIRTVAARIGGLLLTLLVAFALFAGAVSVLSLAGLAVDDVGLLGLVAISVAAVFEPLRRLVDRAVERLLFGDRLDPVTAASRFAAELSTADDPVAALRELRSLLNLPYAAVGDERLLLASGRPTSDGEFTLPLTAAGHQVGELRLGLRPGETGPSARDRPVLRIVAPALAQALRARSLAGEVAASRERVVNAVEEDRRRLRRDLHDGLGPTLTGIAYSTDAARNLIGTDPVLAADLLGRARADTGSAISEVRRLVDGLRPALLDQVGLLAALQQQAAHLRGPDGRRILVAIELPDELPELGAAREVAVYRIVSEALTNVARHADSPSAQVRLALAEDQLLVEVSDAGGADPGPSADRAVGVGLQSMAERVDQLGGALELGPTGHGWRVRATLPLPTPKPAALGPSGA